MNFTECILYYFYIFIVKYNSNNHMKRKRKEIRRMADPTTPKMPDLASSSLVLLYANIGINLLIFLSEMKMPKKVNNILSCYFF